VGGCNSLLFATRLSLLYQSSLFFYKTKVRNCVLSKKKMAHREIHDLAHDDMLTRMAFLCVMTASSSSRAFGASRSDGHEKELMPVAHG
jgi:hypothetical protein